MERMYVLSEYGVDRFIQDEWIRKHIKKDYELDPLDTPNCMQVTPGEKAEQITQNLGIKTWDPALPLQWAKDIEIQYGINPCGHFVWGFPEAGFGKPIAITRTGKILLDILKHRESKKNADSLREQG